MAKICILDSPSWLLFSPRSFLHLGILYLAGSLRAAGHDVHVIDCHDVTSWNAERNELIIHKERLVPCDILGISATTANVHWGKQLAKAWPATLKVLGGSHATYILRGPHELYKRPSYFEGFDYVIIEEAEESFVQFANGFDKGDISQTSNLCWFNALGMLQRNPSCGLPDVTRLAPPAFDLWPSPFAGGVGMSSPGHDKKLDMTGCMTASLFNSRGCPYGCKFCADARTKVRDESYEQVEAQVKQLASFGVRAIRIQDDVLTIKAERCKRIADILHNYGMKWRGNTRVNLNNPELFRYMETKGCIELAFGCEHGSDKMLKLMAKGTTAEKNTESIRMCQDAGMVAKAFIIMGFPGETLQTIEELRLWLLKAMPSGVTFSLFQPYPGSDVWNNPKNYDVSLPVNAFDRFWQVGLEGSEDELVLTLPTISKQDLVKARREIGELIDTKIGHRDRGRVDGAYYGEAVMM